MELNLGEIEQSAADLYVQGNEGHQQLAAAWTLISHDPVAYPEITLQTAKICYNTGDNSEARRRLDFCVQAWRNQPEMLSRVYLMHAQISRSEEDFEQMRDFIAETQALTQDIARLAECQLLLGDGCKASDPSQALHFYDTALKYFQRSRAMRPAANYDVARAAISAADIAFMQHMNIAGWRYQRQAEQAARMINNPMLVTTVLARTGAAYEREGAYDRAFQAFDEAQAAAQASKSPVLVAQNQYRRARLALLMSDDRAAEASLKIPDHFDHHATLCQFALLQGWLAAFHYQFQDAQRQVEQAEAMMRDDPLMYQQTRLLRGLIAVQKSETSPALLHMLKEVFEFFDRRLMAAEASQAALLLAWLYALQRDFAMVKQVVDEVERLVDSLGHATHIARLYQVSLGLMGGWWSATLKEKVEAALKQHHAVLGVRVYAFGAPRVYVGNKELTQRDRYGNLGYKLLIYMLEKKRAQLWEAVEAVWEEGDPEKIPARFHSIMSNLKKALKTEWCSYSDDRRLYLVTSGFPHYYDADDFNATSKLFRKADDPMQRLAQCLKIQQMYDTFAMTLDGDTFDTLRRDYEAQYAQVLLDAQAALPDLLDRAPRHWYEEIAVKLRLEQY